MHCGKPLLTKRVYAFTIDLAVILLIQKTLINLYVSFFDSITFFQNSKIDSSRMQALDGVIMILIMISYFTCSYYIFNGQSIGKGLLKLRVISTKSHEIPIADAFIRANAYLFCLLPVLQFLFVIPFINKDAKGLPDWLSNTAVVTEEFAAVLKRKPATSALPLHTAFEKIIYLGHDQEETVEQNFPQAA